ncbi:unnamed protein product [Amoebophrya sp. A25]|nr:unnamed protein product [Amoebophrya sp. A25]|eukprot:GSA25T00009817001.1
MASTASKRRARKKAAAAAAAAVAPVQKAQSSGKQTSSAKASKKAMKRKHQKKDQEAVPESRTRVKPGVEIPMDKNNHVDHAKTTSNKRTDDHCVASSSITPDTSTMILLKRFANTVADDHCETPSVAYEDLTPILDAYIRHHKLPGRGALRIYDPYYCRGQMKGHLAALGFHDVYNEPVDCYSVWRDPEKLEQLLDTFDVVVTNPPYSGDHLLKLLDFCRKKCRPKSSPDAEVAGGRTSSAAGPGGELQTMTTPSASMSSKATSGSDTSTETEKDLRRRNKLFLLCLPNYVYVRYANLCRDMKYLIPSQRYSYAHAVKKAKTAPFASFWYISGDLDFLSSQDDARATFAKVKTDNGGRAEQTAQSTSPSNKRHKLVPEDASREIAKPDMISATNLSFADQLRMMSMKTTPADAKPSSSDIAKLGSSIPCTTPSEARPGPGSQEQIIQEQDQMIREDTVFQEILASLKGKLVSATQIPDIWKPPEDATKQVVKRHKNSRGQKSCVICGQVYGLCKHTRGMSF